MVGQAKPVERDYFEVLGLKPESTPEDVRRAYLRLARDFHPDRNPDDPSAGRRFKEIAEAYRVLSNDSSRLKYTCFGLREGDSGGDIVAAGLEKEQLGEDIELVVEITLAEHIQGVKRTVVYNRRIRCDNCRKKEPVSCPLCSGSGRVSFSNADRNVSRPCVCCRGTGARSEPCRKCGSTGFVRIAETSLVTIEPGGTDGTLIRLVGLGHHGRREEKSGDLVIMLHLTDLAPFYGQAGELWCDVPVPLSAAVLGGEIEVPTPWGWRTVTLDAGVQPGTRLRLSGMGLMKEYGGGLRKSSLNVRVMPEIPSADNPAMRALFRRLREHEANRVSPARGVFGSELA